MGIYERLRRTPLFFILVVLAICSTLGGCEEQNEGCLDFRALTVNVDADDACQGCCEFPVLKLQFIPVRYDADTVSKFLRSTDTLRSGALVGVAPELGFYLHDIYLIAENGDRVEMQDTFTVFSDNADQSNFLFESSVLRVTPFRQTSYELGTLLDRLSFVAIEARLGLPDVLSERVVANQEVGSPLFRNTDSLLVSAASGIESYLDIDFKYEDLQNAPISVQLEDAADQLIRWELPEALDYEPSYNLLISLGLPVDNLLPLNNGTVNGEVFVTGFLQESQVLETILSR